MHTALGGWGAGEGVSICATGIAVGDSSWTGMVSGVVIVHIKAAVGWIHAVSKCAGGDVLTEGTIMTHEKKG